MDRVLGKRLRPPNFILFPADITPVAAVIVIRLKDQSLSFFTDEFQQIDLFTEVIALPRAHAARPRNMTRNHRPFIRTEERRVTSIGEHRKQRLLVDDLRTKTVDHTDCPRAIGIEQSGMLSHNWEILINQKPLVNNIYFEIANAQTAIAEFQFVRRSDDRRMALRFKILAEQLELFLRGHAFQIDDRDRSEERR